MADCLICKKHTGHADQLLGGYIYESDHWKACRAPSELAPLGPIVLESRRHLLDFAELIDQEALELGPLLRKLTRAIKAETSAERVYSLMLMEGIPHFHLWLVPRRQAMRPRAWRSFPPVTRATHCKRRT